MGRRVGSQGAATIAIAVATLAVSSANAGSMDLAPERLAICPAAPTGAPDLACGGARPNASGTGFDTRYFQPDNDAWAKLVSQYAMAIAPTAMHPARTTGYGGFEMGFFMNLTTISNTNNVLTRGTEGAVTPSNKYPTSNQSPDGVLQIYGLSGRKGLPYGFELQGSIGWLANTELAVIGGGVRLSPFEGFRKYVDLSVGGYVNTITGTSKVKITVPALDVQASRQFVISNQVVLSPYIGWQMVWINADSGVIDATPKVDGLGACNARPSTPTERQAGDTGEFRCQSAPGVDAPAGSPESLAKLDLNNNMVFRNMRGWTRQRAMLGLSIRWENLHAVIPHVMMDLTDPEAGEPDPGAGRAKRLSGVDKQWTFGATVGLSW